VQIGGIWAGKGSISMGFSGFCGEVSGAAGRFRGYLTGIAIFYIFLN
jgi:hypothetical protein